MQVTRLMTTGVFFCMFGPASSSVAQASLQTPAEVVEAFCSKEAEGMGLSGRTIPQIALLTTGEGEAPEDPLVVISSFKVIKVDERKRDADVTVTFKRLGSIVEGESGVYLIRAHTDETVSFPLKRMPEGWRIDNARLAVSPHVRLADVIRYFDHLQ